MKSVILAIFLTLVSRETFAAPYLKPYTEAPVPHTHHHGDHYHGERGADHGQKKIDLDGQHQIAYGYDGIKKTDRNGRGHSGSVGSPKDITVNYGPGFSKGIGGQGSPGFGSGPNQDFGGHGSPGFGGYGSPGYGQGPRKDYGGHGSASFGQGPQGDVGGFGFSQRPKNDGSYGQAGSFSQSSAGSFSHSGAGSFSNGGNGHQSGHGKDQDYGHQVIFEDHKGHGGHGLVGPGHRIDSVGDRYGKKDNDHVRTGSSSFSSSDSFSNSYSGANSHKETHNTRY